MKSSLKFILIVLVISIVLSMGIELLFFNRNVLRINKTYAPNVIDYKDVEIENGKYTTTSRDSYIKIKLDDNYINKLQFNYKVNKDIPWEIIYPSNEEDIIIENKSTPFINKASRVVDLNISELTIHFNNKNVKVSNILVNNSIYILWTRVLFFIVLFIFVPILFKYRKYLSMNLDKTFILIALVTGLMYMLITPKTAYSSLDDQIHLKNSQVFVSTKTGDYSLGFQLLNSHHTTLETKSVEERLEFYKKINELDKNTSDMKIQVNNYSPKYSKIVYLPFKLGFVIADFLHLSLTNAIILAKFLNLLLYTLMIAFAIKISSSGIKKLLFVIGLLISNIFLASQFSYDPTITSSLLLAVALFIRMLEDKKINYKYLIAFILAVIWGSLPKAVYCLFGLLILFIPNDKFKTKKQAWQLKGLITFVMILLISTYVLPTVLGSVSGDTRGGNTDASAQLNFILHSPIAYAKILVKYLAIYGPGLLLGRDTLTGLGYLTEKIGDIKSSLYIVGFVYLLYVTFTNTLDERIINRKIKAGLLLLVIGLLVLIPTALFISFTEVGSELIAGVQPRYFICLLLPLTIIMSPTGNKKNKDNVIELLPIISFTLLMVALFLILRVSVGI